MEDLYLFDIENSSQKLLKEFLILDVSSLGRSSQQLEFDSMDFDMDLMLQWLQCSS